MTQVHEVPQWREIYDPELVQHGRSLAVEKPVNDLHADILRLMERESENFRTIIMPGRGRGVRRDVRQYWHAGRKLDEAGYCLSARLYRVFLGMIPLAESTAQGYINLYATFDLEEMDQFGSFLEAHAAYREIRDSVPMGKDA